MNFILGQGNEHSEEKLEKIGTISHGWFNIWEISYVCTFEDWKKHLSLLWFQRYFYLLN